MSSFYKQYFTKQRKYVLLTIVLWIAIPLFFLLDISTGTIKIPFKETLNALFGANTTLPTWKIIVSDTRLPQSITATAAGLGLSVSGLLMQIYFRNPLAGPSVLGVSSGASLMVLLAMLFMGSINWVKETFVLSNGIFFFAAITGSLLVLLVLLIIQRFSNNYTVLLIAGLMISYLVSSVESILLQFSNAEQIQRFIHWGMGSFSGHTLNASVNLMLLCVIFFVITLGMVKKIDLYNQGETYAKTMGVNIKRVTVALLLISAVLAALITAYCGPIAFIGMAVPHLTRLLINTDKHRIFIPAVAATGVLLALICSTLSRGLLAGISLPLNAVTSIIGAVVVLWLLFKKK